METMEWLPGWTLCDNEKLTLPYILNPRACGMIRETGKTLFRLGALPSYTGFDVAEITRLGTSGNFAVRNHNAQLSFVVTGRGTHKGKLTLTDFCCVFSVDWRKKQVFCASPLEKQPSTDSLLVAKTFMLDTKIRAWAHFHLPISTPYSMNIAYPALQKKDWDALRTLVKKGVREINMVDHDLMRKNNVADGTADAAIIIGEDPEETFTRAVSLVRETMEKKEE